MTEESFKTIKELLALKLTVSQIVGITGKSTSTVGYIKKSATLGDYFALIHTYLAKYEARKNAAKGKELTPEQKEEALPPESVNGSVVGSLRRIADALEKMEVHWRTKVDVR